MTYEMTYEEHIYRGLMAERDAARLNATYWRNKYEAECKVHEQTQKRLGAFVKYVEDNMAVLCNPPVLVLDKDGLHRESLEAALARGRA